MLTREPLQPSPSGQSFERPEVYALALVDRSEPDPQARSRFIVHAQLNLRTAGEPMHSLLMEQLMLSSATAEQSRASPACMAAQTSAGNAG